MGIYKNVMELLVEEEVVRQFNTLSARVASYINQVEWVAYALNQLPPLYATSEKGLDYQLQRGRAKYKQEIQQAVQRALAAIRRDPLRSSMPLQSPQEPTREVLFQLRFLLRNDQLEWESVPQAVESALGKVNQDKVWQSAKPLRTPTVYSPVRGSSPFPSYSSTDQKSEAPKQKSAPSNKLNTPAQPPSTAKPKDDVFGWDDPLYNPR